MSTKDINTEQKLRDEELSLDIHRLKIGDDVLHLCGTCYLNFFEWLDEKKSRMCEDNTEQEGAEK